MVLVFADVRILTNVATIDHGFAFLFLRLLFDLFGLISLYSKEVLYD